MRMPAWLTRFVDRVAVRPIVQPNWEEVDREKVAAISRTARMHSLGIEADLLLHRTRAS